MNQERVTCTVAVVMLVTCALVHPVTADAAERGQVLNPLEAAFSAQAPSVARSDLLACNELGRASVHNPGNLRTGDLVGMLSGTWVRHLTWNGVPIQTESALFFDLDGESPRAMMYDRSNMGGGPMSERLEKLKADQELLSETPTLTFVDCDYLIRDEYFKVSDEILLDGLPVQVSEASQQPLAAAWKQLVEQEYFDKANSAVAPSNLRPRDLTNNPGLELSLPSVVGAYWKVDLTPIKMSGYDGVQIDLDGEYRGTHVGFKIGEAAHAQESAKFFMEGERFVSSVLPGGVLPGPNYAGIRPAAEGDLTGGWETECDDILALSHEVNWERVVLSPAGFVASPSPSGGARVADQHPKNNEAQPAQAAPGSLQKR